MTDTTASAQLCMGEQSPGKARAILDGMSHLRIDPIKIKMTDATRRQKGGQGVVIVGTRSLPETAKKLVSYLKVTAENLGLSPENFRNSLQEMKEKFEKWPPEIDAMAEMIEMGPEALDKWRPEMKVAVKMFGWNCDDIEESTKFFKSFVHELSLMAELCHPNVVRLIGFVEDMEKGKAWMILPWESNGNVREFLKSGEWDIPERISLIQDTARGLEYLHSRQPPICHGDLKSVSAKGCRS
ncbi:hypothetical protein FS837_011355 [Tulasnella sp. UAMH 9824]|nr:hypothetical protein FS837_011355 [Tulasnella sp. UAMH 9824]